MSITRNENAYIRTMVLVGSAHPTMPTRDAAVEFNYDIHGRLSDATNARNAHTAIAERSPQGDVKTHIGAEQETTRFQYLNTEQGKVIRRVTVIDGEGHDYQYDYNGFGELIRERSQATGDIQYWYDKAGNLARKKDGNGLATMYLYDAANRLKTLIHSASPEHNTPRRTVDFEYDSMPGKPESNGIAAGRLTRIADSSGYTTYRYDSQQHYDRDTMTFSPYLERKQTVIELADGTSFNYSETTRDFRYLTEMEYPSGRKIAYHYDEFGYLAKITAQSTPGSDTNPVALLTMSTRFPQARGSQWTLGNGLIRSEIFDDSGRLEYQILSGHYYRNYQYDPAGNIDSFTDSLTGQQEFNYDLSDRLTRAKGPYGDLVYAYDQVGNRIYKSTTGGDRVQKEEYVYRTDSNILDKVTAKTYSLSTNAELPEAYLYREFAVDRAGNTESQLKSRNEQFELLNYDYDGANRLVGVTRGDQTLITSTYNALGQRVKTVTPSGVEYYVYGSAGQLLAVLGGDGKPLREYIYFGAQKMAMYVYDGSAPQGRLYYLHNDHLGTTGLITDTEQNVVWETLLTPFGLVYRESGAAGLDKTRFPGQYSDESTGTYYNYFRDYDPSLGRYLQSDPIGLAGGINTYAYVGGNPLLSTDPYGLARHLIIIGDKSANGVGALNNFVRAANTLANDLRAQGHSVDVVDLDCGCDKFGIQVLYDTLITGPLIDGGLTFFGHGAPGGISLSSARGDNLQSQVASILDYTNFGPNAVIDIRACNSGTYDKKDRAPSIAEAISNASGLKTIGYPTPYPHNTGLNFSSENAPYNPSPNELANPNGPLYLVPMTGTGHQPTIFGQ